SATTGEFSTVDWATVSPTAFGAWAYVAAFGSVAYGCYLWLLKASTPAKAATYAYVNPVIALFLGYLLADETLTLWSMGCSAVVVAGVLLVVSR
ncbi:MAG: EamA family transporter, partial [Acidobacteria bacterium]|nr:EamA family transporter [Acidobacteriota bacterium]